MPNNISTTSNSLCKSGKYSELIHKSNQRNDAGKMRLFAKCFKYKQNTNESIKKVVLPKCVQGRNGFKGSTVRTIRFKRWTNFFYINSISEGGNNIKKKRNLIDMVKSMANCTEKFNYKTFVPIEITCKTNK